MDNNVIDLDEYRRRMYGTQMMPESKQKLVNRLCYILLVFDLLVIITWILLSCFTTPSTFLDVTRIIYYSSAILASVVYCSLRIILFVFYYVKWFTRLQHRLVLRISQIIGGFITINVLILSLLSAVTALGGMSLYLLFIVPLVPVLVYGIIVPKLQYKRQLLVRGFANNVPQNAPPHIINYQDPSSGVIASNSTQDAEQAPVSVTPVVNTLKPAVTPVLVDARQETMAASAILCGAIMCDIWAYCVTNMLASGLYSKEPSVKGMTGLVGLCFCLPLVPGMIAVCATARSRRRRIRLYEKQEQCKVAMGINKIAIILALLPIAAFATIILMILDQIF